MKKPVPESAMQAISQMRRLLADWLRASEQSREPVAKMLDLLEVVDEFVQAGSKVVGTNSKSVTGGRSSSASYSIDKSRNDQEVLAEHRVSGSSQPFRVPKELYNAVAEALAGAVEAMDFETLSQAVSKKYSEPAEFQLRTALRFMMSVKPPLILRERNRYRSARKGKFENEAKNAWAALAKQSK